MNNIGYLLTDWIFFFNQRNRTDLNRILTDANHEDIPGEFITLPTQFNASSKHFKVVFIISVY